MKALLRRALKLFTPPERIKCSDWARKYRRLSPEASSQGGHFSFDDAPWQIEPMDAPDDPEVASVVLMWASQTAGKTETVNNIVGHTIDVDPCPILVIQPTLELGETWSKDRLATMLRDTPRLRGKVKDAKTRDSGNKILYKRFPGGHITIAGANSPASLASRPIRKVLFDEVDRFPASAGNEGDPIALAEKRTESFPDAVTIKVSTPTLKGLSRIEKEFEKSDKRYWFCPCPKCGFYQTLKWCQVKWGDDPDNPWYECENPECQAHLTDADRRRMIRRGEWRATAPFTGIRGYHLNGIYALFPPKKPFKNRLQQMVAAFLEAKAGGLETLKVWTNTFLAETWEDPTGEKPDWEALFDRREDYGGDDPKNPIIPAKVGLLVAAVDVQRNRLEYEVIGYGLDEETWGIERGQIYGNPHQDDVWSALDELLDKTYTHENGAKLRIATMAIDISDGQTAIPVARYVRPRQVRRVWAVKGSSTPNAPITSTARRGKKVKVPVFMVGTDTAKATIYARLNILDPGPRYMHWPKGFGYDSEYFKQLTAESVRTEWRKGVPVRVWRKERDRNEALDIRVYALAVVEILNPNMKKLMEYAQKDAEQPASRDYVLKPAEDNPKRDATESQPAPEPEAPPVKRKPVIRRKNNFIGRWKQ